jgi:hypothetical protein
MLQESLALRPMGGTAAAEANLHGRGFRHIPPIGFLPVVPKALAVDEKQGRKLEEACTFFSLLTSNEEEPNPYLGTMASFAIPNNPNQFNRIREGVGFFVDHGSPSCVISLDEIAEEITVVLVVREIGTTVTVIAKGALDANGTRPILQSVSVAQANRVETITLSGGGIRQVEISNQYLTFIRSFCYRYYLAVSQPSGLPPRTLLVREALRQAEAYFAGTNVIPYGVVALHDDDILEDLHNVIDKDPLQLEQPLVKGDGDSLRNGPRPNATSSDRIAALGWDGLLLSARGGKGLVQFLLLLGSLLRSQGLEIDALVNRRTEVVKLVVPLQGLSRRHPLLGAITEDAVRQAPGWGLAGPADLDTSTLAGLLRERGVDMLPRSFVVYVKQRLVLLDLVFQLLELLQMELLQKLIEFFLAANGGNIGSSGFLATNPPRYVAGPPTRASAMTAATTNDYRIALRTQSESAQLLIRSTLAQPLVQELLLKTMVSATPTLAKANRSQAFLDQVAFVSSEQPAAISDLNKRQAIALGQVADAWAAEYPDAQVLQLLAAVQPA